MRLIKQLTITLAIVSVAFGCVFGTHQALATGAQGGGGGNSSGPNTARPDEIQQAVYISKFALKLVLTQMLESGYSDLNKDHTGAIVQYVLSKPHLFEDLAALKIHPQIAPCQYDGLKRDGDIHGNDVCISLSRLQSYQYSQNDILRKVTGLLGHEFAHKRGITFAHDSDADIFRNEVEQYVPVGTVDNFITSFTNNGNVDVMDDVTTIDQAYSTFRANADIGLPQACAAAAFVVIDLQSLWDSISNFGQTGGPVLSSRSRNLFTTALFRTGLVTMLGCGVKPTTDNKGLSALYDVLQNMPPQISMFDFSFIESLEYAKMNSGSGAALTKAEFDRDTCGQAVRSPDCFGLKSTYLQKLTPGDLNAMKLQMFKAQTELIGVESELFPILREANRLNDEYFRHECLDSSGWMISCSSQFKTSPAQWPNQ